MSTKGKSHKYFEIEVSLVGAEPKVWRQFLIHKYSTFGDLHKAIQVSSEGLLPASGLFPLRTAGALPGYQRCVDAYHDPKNAEEDLLV